MCTEALILYGIACDCDFFCNFTKFLTYKPSPSDHNVSILNEPISPIYLGFSSPCSGAAAMRGISAGGVQQKNPAGDFRSERSLDRRRQRKLLAVERGQLPVSYF